MNTEKTAIKKKDLLLILVILCVALGLWLLRGLTAGTGGSVTVTVDGETVGTYDLSKDREIVLNGGTNILEIRDGEAFMKEANCPDQICVHQKAIRTKGSSIICLPNRVVAEIRDGSEDGIDAVAE